MQFKEGVDVISADGEKVGEVERVVIDPKDGSVTHVVVRKGFLLPRDTVLPIDMISRTSDEAVRLHVNADRIENLPEYIETEFIPLDNDYGLEYGYQPGAARHSYWYPGVGAAPLMWRGGYWGTYPSPAVYPYRVVEEKNIPEGTIALKEGAKVIGKDGEHVGDVENILVDREKEQVTHMVITKGVFDRDKKLIPAGWINRIKDDAVELSVDSKFIEHLQNYQE
jgi:uncharacterized protein YrrD